MTTDHRPPTADDRWAGAVQHFCASIAGRLLVVARLWLAVGLLLPGLLGCSLLQAVQSIGAPGEATQPSLVAAQPSASPVPASATPTVTFTPPAAASPLPPTLTATVTPNPAPSLFPSFTPPPSVTPGKLPTFAIRLPPTPTSRPCCTLRVTNAARRTYWIGTHPPTLGNWIKPDQYIEFYYPVPTSLRVYWCRYRADARTVEGLLDCQNKLVTVLDGLTRIEVK